MGEATTDQLILDVAKSVQKLPEDEIQRFVQVRGFQLLVGALTQSTNPALLAEAATALGYIAFRQEQFAHEIVGAGAIAPLVKLCDTVNPHDVISAAMGTLFLFSFDKQTKAEIIQCGGCGALIDVLRTTQDLKARCVPARPPLTSELSAER